MPDQLTPLSDEEKTALRRGHVEWIRNDGVPTGLCFTCEPDGDWPCQTIRLLDQLERLEVELKILEARR